MDDCVLAIFKTLEALRIYTSSILNTEDATAQARIRKPRAAPLARMALASVGLFGSRIALGSGSCGLRGIFGSCHDRAKQYTNKIENLAEFTESLTQDVFNLRNELNDKFFMVTRELEALKSVQKEMLEVQNRNWRIIEEHFEVFQQNIHVLRDSDQLLFCHHQFKRYFWNVKVASGQTVKVLAQVDVKFKVNDHNFQDSLLILPSLNSVVLGNPFFKKFNIEISPGENLLKLPEMTYQLNEIRTPKEDTELHKVEIQFLCTKKQLSSPKISEFSTQK